MEMLITTMEKMTDYDPTYHKVKHVKKRPRLLAAFSIILGIALLSGAGYLLYQSFKSKPDNIKNIVADNDNKSMPDYSSTVINKDRPNLEARLDSCMWNAFLILGVDTSKIKVKRTKESSGLSGISVKEIKVSVPKVFPNGLSNDYIHREFRRKGGDIITAHEIIPGRKFEIHGGYNGFTTHIMTVYRDFDLDPIQGNVALIIGGFGEVYLNKIDNVFELGIPFTASVIPGALLTDKSIAALEKNGIEKFCAIPMEPHGALDKTKNENMIFTVQSDSEIRRLSKDAINSVPGAVGATNHMGSMATEDTRVMLHVFNILADQKLPFLDSKTSSHSIADSVALANGYKASVVDFVIDAGDTSTAYCASRFYDFALMSRTLPEGAIISIRARESSINMLQEHLNRVKKMGINFIPVSEMIERKQKWRNNPQKSSST